MSSKKTIPVEKCSYEDCAHEWVPRVPNPRCCPKCKRYLDKVETQDA